MPMGSLRLFMDAPPSGTTFLLLFSPLPPRHTATLFRGRPAKIIHRHLGQREGLFRAHGRDFANVKVIPGEPVPRSQIKPICESQPPHNCCPV